MSIKISNVFKHYGNTKVLDGINLNIEEGEFVSVVGPSGCGKTTLLRIIAGFLRPSSGAIFLNHKSVVNIPARKRGVGMVFQNYALFPNMNVYQNIAFGLQAKGVTPKVIKEKVSSLLRLVHLEGMERAMPPKLSGGQQQRVAMARSLAISPKVLLLDEPLSALDAKVRLELRYELKRIQRDTNITAIYVTHDQEEALSISDRVAVLNKGRIQQVDTPSNIYLHPRSRFVAEFIGVSNILHTEVVSGSSGIVKWMDHELFAPPFAVAGSKVLITIRPEKIHLTADDWDQKKEKRSTVLSGTMIDKVFLGAYQRLAVKVGEQIFYVDVPNVEDGGCDFGDRLLLRIDSSAVHIIS